MECMLHLVFVEVGDHRVVFLSILCLHELENAVELLAMLQDESTCTCTCTCTHKITCTYTLQYTCF